AAGRVVRPAARRRLAGEHAGALAASAGRRWTGAWPVPASAALVAEEALDVFQHLLGVRARVERTLVGGRLVVVLVLVVVAHELEAPDVAGEVLVLVEVAVDLGLVLGHRPLERGARARRADQ